jgi:hypothetical protein
MFAGRGLILRVQPAIAAVAPGALHALLEADEAAIATAAATHAAAQILAPWIVLRMRARIRACRRDENSNNTYKNSKQIPHGRPPGSALALKLLTPQAARYSPASRTIEPLGHKQRGRLKGGLASDWCCYLLPA